MKKIRVLHVLNGAIGGACLSTCDLIKGLEAYGVNSMVYCSERANREDIEKLQDTLKGQVKTGPLYIWSLRSRKPFWQRELAGFLQSIYTLYALRSSQRIINIAKDFDANIIHSSTAMSPDGAIAASVLGIPHVWHIRELIGYGTPHRLRGDTSKKAAERFSRTGSVIANSCATARSLFKDTQMLSKIHVIYNGINTERLINIPLSNEPKNSLTFGMIGHLTSEWKNHSSFIKAASIVKEKHPHFKFIIVGRDPSNQKGVSNSKYAESLHQLVENLNLSDKLTFIGQVSNIDSAMKELDVLVHPSNGESFGRIYVEAIAAGRLVIAPEGAASEILTLGNKGKGCFGAIITNPTPQEIADSMVDISTRYNEIQKQVSDARHDFTQTFSPLKCAGEVYSLYLDALSSNIAALSHFNAIYHVMN
jgi:glycosyltransferase involved in cell wall biosynthesis